MRHYPVNSPRASARILALAASSQGRLSRLQMEAVRRLRVIEQLGLEPHIWHEVLTYLYTDLLPLQQRSWTAVFNHDAQQLEKLLDEVEDPKLRYTVFSLSSALAELESDPGAQPNPLRSAIQERWKALSDRSEDEVPVKG